jgi:hypothetical protein
LEGGGQGQGGGERDVLLSSAKYFLLLEGGGQGQGGGERDVLLSPPIFPIAVIFCGTLIVITYSLLKYIFHVKIQVFVA